MVLEDVEDQSCDGLMGLRKISTTSVLETGKISPLTVPDEGVVLSRPRPTLGCSAHDDDDDDDDEKGQVLAGRWRNMHDEELHNSYSSPHIIRLIKTTRMRVAGT
jgi:hypothetical protein